MSDRRILVGRMGIYEKPLTKLRGEVSLSAFSFLFSEIIQYYQTRVSETDDIETKLSELGHDIGLRVIELISIREKVSRRETKIVTMLHYITNTVWRHLFNKVADNLERSTADEDVYMIHENSPVTNVYFDLSKLNGASFLAGIISGVLHSCRFNATVTAHVTQQPTSSTASVSNIGNLVNNEKAVFLIKFSNDVIIRDRKLQ